MILYVGNLYRCQVPELNTKLFHSLSATKRDWINIPDSRSATGTQNKGKKKRFAIREIIQRKFISKQKIYFFVIVYRVRAQSQSERSNNKKQIKPTNKRESKPERSVAVTQLSQTITAIMIDTLTYNPQPENWLYEIRQKGHDSTCYVMVPHARVGFTSQHIYSISLNVFVFGFVIVTFAF